MDPRTTDYYNREASRSAARFNSINSPLESLFPLFLDKGDKVLDIGCGGGRDTALLLDMGMDAYGLDPGPDLLREAERIHRQLKGRLFTGSLPDVPESLPSPFDHLVMSAVIMHIPDSELFSCAFALRNLLKPGGTLILSHCPQRKGIGTDNRDDSGRLFVLRSSEQITLMFEGLGFQKKHLFQNNDSMGREGIVWETLILEYTGTINSESVDRIESIINNDRKTASYKLALLRALCDLAQRDPLTARWNSSGKVEVPIRAVADKWLEYYFPLVGNSAFVPQNRGETPDSKKPIAFRHLLKNLSEFYGVSSQGLAQFQDDRDRNRFDKETAELYSETIKSISTAIKNGPVVYSSGSVFRYIKERKSIEMEGALWRELVLLGHWIEDSLILKWAHLINEFSRTTTPFPVNKALELLMLEPDFERRVGPAKIAYGGIKDIPCVWSDKSLNSKSLVIDHAIPFALRHDNSLWNLLPADNKVNLSKSDKLPTSTQMQRSRDRIIYSWELLYASQKDLFSAEAGRFLGKSGLDSRSWETDLFSAFFETVETTANRRGVERWEW